MDMNALGAFVLSNAISRHAEVIVIDGTVCGGKTTLAKAIQEMARNEDILSVCLSTDDFLIERGCRNYHENHDLRKLENWYLFDEAQEVLRSLLSFSGDAVIFKAYNRSQGGKRFRKVLQCRLGDLFILEGLFAIDWFVRASTPNVNEMRVFLTAGHATRSRHKCRSNSIAMERWQYEYDQIVLPCVQRYCSELASRGVYIDLCFDTSDIKGLRSIPIGSVVAELT